jgi:hypothetical protein
MRRSSGVDWGSNLGGKDVRQSMSLGDHVLRSVVLESGLLEVGLLERGRRSGEPEVGQLLSKLLRRSTTEYAGAKGLENQCRVDGGVPSSEGGKLISLECNLPTLVSGVAACLLSLTDCIKSSSVLDEQWVWVWVGVGV